MFSTTTGFLCSLALSFLPCSVAFLSVRKREARADNGDGDGEVSDGGDDGRN